MNLYLLRHGLAVEPGCAGVTADSERPLTPEGKLKLRKTARAMEALGLSFDAILSSPYVRARQTASLIAEAFKRRDQLELTDALTPSGSAKKLVTMLARRKPIPEDVLLVGHEPNLSQLISLLISGELRASVIMKKGGLCKLSTGELRNGSCASLEWLLTPKQMSLMC